MKAPHPRASKELQLQVGLQSQAGLGSNPCVVLSGCVIMHNSLLWLSVCHLHPGDSNCT